MEQLILYESYNFIVACKGFDVLINDSNERDKKNTLCDLIKKSRPGTDDSSIEHGYRMVQRLDFATSGAVCMALNKKAAASAGKALASRRVTKHYLALVRGHLLASTTDINLSIGRNSAITTHCVMVTSKVETCFKAREARTTAVLLQRGTYDGEPASKLLLIPHTGRTHQLRVHCAHIGHVIVGDYTYSEKQDVRPHRMMLHAYRLQIPMRSEFIDVITEDPFTPKCEPFWQPEEDLLSYEQYCCESTSANRNSQAPVHWSFEAENIGVYHRNSETLPPPFADTRASDS